VEVFFPPTMPKSTPHPLGSLRNTPVIILPRLLTSGEGVGYASKISSGDSEESRLHGNLRVNMWL